MPTSPYTIRLDDEVREALEQEAERAKRPAAQLAVSAITSMLAAQSEKRAAIEAALTEADAGAFISEAAMTRWVDSWGSDAELPEPEADITP